ncbi:MAG: PKD domain-containing protein [Candidatus Sumerlaeia bacterium]|nr:PKD domain-containing protein [Candidatus Sumerlaeia bacterium]
MTVIFVFVGTTLLVSTQAQIPEPTREPLRRVIELNVGESAVVELSNGKTVAVKLLDLKETRDTICDAVRKAEVTVEVNGQTATFVSANYRLPVTVGGVQIDCPITKGYLSNSRGNPWGLEKDVRLRLWPAGSPLTPPGTFLYPLKQRLFASGTQMANEPVHVDGGDLPGPRSIYYHSGEDFGGAEGMVDCVACVDGVVVMAGTDAIADFKKYPIEPRYDRVDIVDDQGWFYRYSHLVQIDPAMKVGARVKKGQKVGVLGKEGSSGGWAHLHFAISSIQPNGKYGVEAAYPLVWEAYLREYKPEIVAVARPHILAWAGETVVLDGTRSWAESGKIAKYEWTFCDGTKAEGATVERVYSTPGTYSEILKVTDAAGNVSYDFGVVQTLDKAHPQPVPPSIQAAFAPTMGIKPGDRVTFMVRTFRTTDNQEEWDFGDGSPKVTVKSDGNVKALAKDGFAVTTHAYKKPGDYIATVERANALGHKAIGRVWVRVAP